MSILSIENLSKSFGAAKVIDGISFEVAEKSIFGFIGKNGAGKTTTMKMILGLLKSDGGYIEVCGEPVNYGQTKTNRFIGYLPDVPEFYNYMTPKEYLMLCGEITGLSASVCKKRCIDLIELVGLEKANRKIGGFSRGMKQRLGIAQALINEPKLLICDEPTSALDPIGRKELLDILERVKVNTTVLFSTHILSDVERICDRIALLNNGKLALCGTITELREQHKQDGLFIEFESLVDLNAFLSKLGAFSWVNKTESNGTSLTIKVSDIKRAEKDVLNILSDHQLLPLKFEIMEPSIETLFMEAVQ